MLLPYDQLYEQAKRLDDQGDNMFRNFRMVHEGVLGGYMADPKRADHHVELSTHGVWFYEKPVENTGTSNDGLIPFVMLKDLLWPLMRGVDGAVQFFSGSLTNLLIRCELFGCDGVAYLFTEPRRLVRPENEFEQRQCADNVIRVETYATAETLAGDRIDVFTDVLRRMVWAFSYRPKDDFRALVVKVAGG